MVRILPRGLVAECPVQLWRHDWLPTYVFSIALPEAAPSRPSRGALWLSSQERFVDAFLLPADACCKHGPSPQAPELKLGVTNRLVTHACIWILCMLESGLQIEQPLSASDDAKFTRS